MPITLEEHLKTVFKAIKIIAENEGLSISELSKLLGKNRPQTYTIVNALKSLGLIDKIKERGVPPKTKIILTERGRVFAECIKDLL